MRVNWIAALLASLGVCGSRRGPGALAQDAAMPTPKVVIYPGDIIRDDMLADLPAETAVGFGPFAETRSALVGKMARRTLLPGAAIPLAGVDNPRLVANGAEVKLVYMEGGLTIVTVGRGSAGRRSRRRHQGAQQRQRRDGHRGGPARRHRARERRVMRRLILIPVSLRVRRPGRWRRCASRTSPSLRGARDNQLIGYGLVVGLQGTGDTLRNVPFTEQAIQCDARSHGRQRPRQPRCAIATWPR